MGNGDCSGRFSKKRGKGRPKKQKKRDHSWIDSSSDYETGYEIQKICLFYIFCHFDLCSSNKFQI